MYRGWTGWILLLLFLFIVKDREKFKFKFVSFFFLTLIVIILLPLFLPYWHENLYFSFFLKLLSFDRLQNLGVCAVNYINYGFDVDNYFLM